MVYMLISRNSCLTHALLCRIYRRLICPTDENASAELVSGAGGRRSSTAAQRFVRVGGSSGSVACFICRKRYDLARRWLRSGASRHPTSATCFACIGVTSKLAEGISGASAAPAAGELQPHSGRDDGGGNILLFSFASAAAAGSVACFICAERSQPRPTAGDGGYTELNMAGKTVSKFSSSLVFI